jgi:quercetin dioxygenase-like cupin family protein
MDKQRIVRIPQQIVMLTTMFAALHATAVQATPPPAPQPITRTVLEKRPIPGTDESMEIILVVLQPGVAAPVHHHSVAGLNYILDGTAESAYGTDAPKLYHTGDTLQDLPDVPHTVFRNVDKQKPLRFLIFANVHANQPYSMTP